MARSMTGFGSAQEAGEAYELACEIKSVNHRFLDMQIRMPRRYMMLEERIKELLKKSFARGRLDLNINVKRSGGRHEAIKVDKEMAMAYYKSLGDLADYLRISPDFGLIEIFRMPDVFTLEEQEESLDELWLLLEPLLCAAAARVLEMRIVEGASLVADMQQRCSFLLEQVDRIETRSPLVVEEYRLKLARRMKELLDQAEPDEQRIMSETAFFADRSSITEELVRLRSHIRQFDVLLGQEESIGRKGDFLIQEMFREINTIASKANDLDITRITVDCKAELEKIREQLQNLE